MRLVMKVLMESRGRSGFIFEKTSNIAKQLRNPGRHTEHLEKVQLLQQSLDQTNQKRIEIEEKKKELERAQQNPNPDVSGGFPALFKSDQGGGAPPEQTTAVTETVAARPARLREGAAPGETHDPFMQQMGGVEQLQTERGTRSSATDKGKDKDYCSRVNRDACFGSKAF